MSTDNVNINGSGAAQGADAVNNTPSAGSAGGGENVNGSTKFNSMAELRDKEPKLYKQILIGIGMGICNQSRRAQERHHRLMKEAERNKA